MEIRRNEESGKVTLSLEGRLDTITSPSFEEALIPEFDKAAHVDLDFSQLAYVSSAGLRVLLKGEKTAKAKGAKMTIANVSAEMMDVFNMTGLSNVLHII